jgi:hypothetical protein
MWQRNDEGNGWDSVTSVTRSLIRRRLAYGGAPTILFHRRSIRGQGLFNFMFIGPCIILIVE